LLENVILNESPGSSVPDPKTPTTSDVAVWPTEPLFVQQTVVPNGTVRLEGVKAYSVIETIVSPAWQGVVAAGAESGPPGRASSSPATSAAASA
jgi:hypothetical protein